MTADFATLLVEPPRVRCLGVVLQPFALGHLLTLRAIGSRFVIGEFPLFEDLIAGAFICAHTWEENQMLLRSKWRRNARLKMWGWLAGRFDVPANLVALDSHIRSGQELAETVKSRGASTRYLVSEWEARLFAYLRSIGYSDSEILNMPLLRAHALFVAYLEENNLMEFKSRRAIAVEDRMTQLVEEMEREAFSA